MWTAIYHKFISHEYLVEERKYRTSDWGQLGILLFLSACDVCTILITVTILNQKIFKLFTPPPSNI